MNKISEIAVKNTLKRLSFRKKRISNADYTPNEKTAEILLDKNNYSTGFDNLEDLFEDLEKD
jgi:hypothetical protein